MRKRVLTIAGSDSSGGAGIQADLKTMLTNGVYGMSAITALTAQNTTGVTDVLNSTPTFLEAQLRAVYDDIVPDAVKIGMVSQPELVRTIAEVLTAYGADNVVVDPVMVATSGAALIEDETLSVLTELLFPLATVITPNLKEGELLADMAITSKGAMVDGAKKIFDRYHVAVLLKGGHLSEDSDDLLYDGQIHWFYGKRLDNPNTHGTGCTLSSAIACNLAKGDDLKTAIFKAKLYLTQLLARDFDLGRGSGPLDHGYFISEV
ncbi:bifunctional hydroxymethylpyrimidine kinase/phosphomethylpyrimidine kinase [Peptoniphilus equinus]|uniref:Hydroxymethylpyrimidine/phosphomethylpyrimidine kinase n=1 Tax=Peptoniphilus equinus TaxID=3016343 RepID=A0ABY7QSS8_9FIRM|nr:bifunctional hydroxymethylpyrimidine kinase/phosphomethylpyrimidine kinase [Peptoniphilus equinus]WBW49832.1 bifunctional hydroxymethylpyrimidine kinase/phosphomethylpyrimidine kinase [Peptoniphilus equinus]